MENRKKQKEEKIKKLVNYIHQNQEKWYRLAYSYAKEQEMALDIVQEAITKAISKIDTLKQIEYMQTWFYRILVNTAIDEIKKRKKQQELIPDDYSLDVTNEEWITGLELYQKVDTLPPKLKTIIILRFFEDKKLSEIAQITNTNENTVKTRLYKALQKLKIQIQEEEYE